jgi:hypothetical protein
MADGTLKECTIEYRDKKKKKSDKSPQQQLWIGCLFACGRSGRTLGAAGNMYKKKLEKAGLGISGFPSRSHGVSPCPDAGPIWKQKVSEVFPWTCKSK